MDTSSASFGTIDLHVHSSCSDGTYTPSELAAYAKKKRLAAFALTDHDTLDGLQEAALASQKAGVELVPGIEFSTEYQGKDIHILGLSVQPEQKSFQRELTSLQETRDERNARMADLLREKEGFDISLKQLQAAYGHAVLTRAHFGQYLLEKGYIRQIRDAFALYIGDSCPYFVPRVKVPPAKAIRLILEAGGIPILAHPLLYRLTEPELETLILGLKKDGLVGLEAIYSANTGTDEMRMRCLARKYELRISGGSDFHGAIKPHIDLGSGKGNLKIPYEILQKLRA